MAKKKNDAAINASLRAQHIRALCFWYIRTEKPELMEKFRKDADEKFPPRWAAHRTSMQTLIEEIMEEKNG